MTTLRDEERDALAAHVERLATWISENGWHADSCDILDLDEDGKHKPCSCGLDVISDTPTASLARRDARMKAEALEEVSMLYPSGVGAEFDSIRADLQGCAHDYRKQAEGRA